jgi:acylphosphatase
MVSGRVQGVWFRQSTADEAGALGVTGWVRNLPDGRVEAVFEGERGAVEQALDYARLGPPRAYVESVDVEWESPRGEHGFRVR